MEILSFLIPVSLFLGFLGLVAFFWAIRDRQFEDLEGDGHRILRKDYDDRPKADRTED
jgi:cbb3-type cytochrome oxidase maturation protein